MKALTRITLAGIILGLCIAPAAADDAGKNTAAIAAPKIGKDKKPQEGFIKQHEAYLAIAKKGDVDVLFLGDSITAGWRGAGKEAWAKNFAPLKAANFGIGGDRTQHVLWRITNGELEGITPKVAVLMIGTNNVGSNKPEEIAGGVTAIVKTIREKSPHTKVLLLAVFPRGKMLPNPQNDVLVEVNKIIARLDDGKNVRFLDINPKLLKDGQMAPDFTFTPDNVHLRAKGYEVWAEAILPLLNEMLGKK